MSSEHIVQMHIIIIFFTISELESLQGHWIRFEDEKHPFSKQSVIRTDGTPFVILSTDVFECHQGPHPHENKGTASVRDS